MKSSTPLIRVVTEAMFLGVYDTQAAAEFKLILFLAKVDGTWTVGGRFPSLESETLWRVGMAERRFHRAMQTLSQARVVTIAKVGRSTIYALSQAFLARCSTLYEARNDQALMSQLMTDTSVSPALTKLTVSTDTSVSPHIETGKSQEETTAEAARGLRPHEGEPMDNLDFPPEERPKKGRRNYDPPALGEDPERPLAATKTVRGPDPRSKAVRDVRQAFEHKLLPISVAKRVPLYSRVNRALANIKFMLDQGHELPVLVGAFDYFASQADSMVFMGESLWDLFFARRDEAIKYATVSAIGSHGGPQESLADKGRRQASRLSQQKEPS